VILVSDEENCENKSGVFQEDNGSTSWIRISSFIALLWSIVITLLDLLGKTGTNGNAIIYATMFLIAAFAPKVVQKFAESKRMQ
jgi:hypothetical protein